MGTTKDDFERPVIYRGIKIEPPIGRKLSPLAKAIREALRADAQARLKEEDHGDD